MNYSTFDLNNFFIKKDSTLPELTYPLTQHTMEQYNITPDMLNNVAVTFSMIEANSGLYRIANVPANLVINNNRPESPAELQFTLMYRFKLPQTSKPGRFYGEFKLDFIYFEGSNGGCGKLTLPIDGQINIIISDSITKTTVI
jgi:hypothetical protein